MQAFLGSINFYSRIIQNVAIYGAVLYQLKEEDFGYEATLTAALTAFNLLQQQVSRAPILRHFV